MLRGGRRMSVIAKMQMSSHRYHHHQHKGRHLTTKAIIIWKCLLLYFYPNSKDEHFSDKARLCLKSSCTRGLANKLGRNDWNPDPMLKTPFTDSSRHGEAAVKKFHWTMYIVDNRWRLFVMIIWPSRYFRKCICQKCISSSSKVCVQERKYI